MKQIIKLFAVVLLIAIALQPAFALDIKPGATAKIPYPLAHSKLTLNSQKVNITVYSTFIEVNAEYSIKNSTGSDIRTTLGFPVYRNSSNPSLGENPPIDIQVIRGKKEGNEIIKKRVETSENEDGFYKEWYMWETLIPSNRDHKLKMHYYIKLNRANDSPNFTYAMKPALAYDGPIKHSEIEIDMPIDCKTIKESKDKNSSAYPFFHASLPDVNISKNILKWELSDFIPDKNLEISFNSPGLPCWEALASADGTGLLSLCTAVTDGDPTTFWMSDPKKEGLGSFFQFKPASGTNSSIIKPVIFKIGIIPGNCTGISDFYNFTHLKEAEVFISSDIQKAGNAGITSSTSNKTPQIDRPKEVVLSSSIQMEGKAQKPVRKPDVIYVDCTADAIMQTFKSDKPLQPQNGTIKMLTTMVYPGQKRKELCIGEILIFDRQPKQTFDQAYDTVKVFEQK